MKGLGGCKQLCGINHIFSYEETMDERGRGGVSNCVVLIIYLIIISPSYIYLSKKCCYQKHVFCEKRGGGSA